MAQTSLQLDGIAEVIFRLTRNNLHEGGRPRVGEAYLNVNGAKADFFGRRDVTVLTDTGLEFPAKLSGNAGRGSGSPPKNFRSRPSRLLGYWLVQQCGAQPGDEVHASPLGGGRFYLRFVRVTSAGGD